MLSIGLAAEQETSRFMLKKLSSKVPADVQSASIGIFAISRISQKAIAGFWPRFARFTQNAV